MSRCNRRISYELSFFLEEEKKSLAFRGSRRAAGRLRHAGAAAGWSTADAASVSSATASAAVVGDGGAACPCPPASFLVGRSAAADMVARATGSGQEPAPAATARRCPDARAAAAHGIGDARDGHRADAPRRRALDAQEGGAAGAGTRGPGAALPRRGSTRRHGMHVVSAFVLLLSYAATRVQAAGGSGLFRFGHISWHAQGNTVSFTLETAFRKSVSDPKFRDAKVGDRLLLFGKEPPQFLYGDSQFASTLVMEVTAVSETEDWVMGVTELKHTYATPNNKQRPWRAQLVGCCRLSEMKNNADLGFELTAEVDLTVAKRSPRAATLPMVTVPLAGKPDGNAHAAAVPPSAYIPSRSGNNVAWNVGTPIDVGSAAALKSASHSYLELRLSGLQQTGHTCDQNSVGAGCFVQMLSGDPTVGGGAAALTVEGWVKVASPEGGYILSTNHLSVSGKRISTLSVVANETHIVVGHERESGENASVATFHMAFATGANLTDRWSHVALVRTLEATDSSKTQCSTQDSVAAHHAVCSRTDDGCHCPLCGATPGLETVAYRVYLDGHELFQEGVDPADIEVVCGPQCNGTACVSATEGSLVFGAYGGPRGGAGMYLDGWLDEWRFWNGVRTQGKIQVRNAGGERTGGAGGGEGEGVQLPFVTVTCECTLRACTNQQHSTLLVSELIPERSDVCVYACASCSCVAGILQRPDETLARGLRW